MAVVHSEIPTVVNDSCSSSDSLAHFTSSRSDDGQSSENFGTRINDLPEEVVVMIFMELDSVTRKKIQSVCRKWCEILQEVKLLRTHVKLELEDLHEKSLDSLLRYYVMSTPEVEFLHLNGLRNPEKAGYRGVDLERALVPSTILRFRNADLLLTNDSFFVPMDFHLTEYFKRIIIREAYVFPVLLVRQAGYSYRCRQSEGKWFQELVLNLADDPYQLSNIFLNDSGPLTVVQNFYLSRISADLQDCLSGIESSFARVGVTMDLRGLLAGVAAGRSIPKFIANMLAWFLFRFCFPDGWPVSRNL